LDDAAPGLGGEHRCNICIVGGGYLGLWTAIQLRQQAPELSITLLEARICGAGASGRNSGMALAWWSKFEALVARCGSDEALRLCTASQAAISAIADFCAAYSISSHFVQTGWLWGATCPRQEDRWLPLVRILASYGAEPFRLVFRNSITELVDVDGFRSGALDPSAATIQPAALARGLRRVAKDLGVTIFEQSPMKRLLRHTLPTIITNQGRVTAERVVLAINAWSLGIPELRRGIFVITSDDAVTAPAPDFLQRHRWTKGPILTNSSVFVAGYRPTHDGRIVAGVTGGAIKFGSLHGDYFGGRSPRERAIREELHIAFRDADQLRLLTSWRGPIDRTRDGLPLFGRLETQPNISFGYGFSGNGIVGCYLGAKFLASLVLDRKDEWTESSLVRRPDSWMPPEPLRYFGAHLVRWAVRQKDRFDCQNRDQGFIASRLASLAPGGIVTTRSGTV
jgi:glycine/D-amino acid oxidase-like deaminating enzyme